MKKSQFIILIYFSISVTFGYVHSIGNNPKENKLFRSPTSRKASSILRDILKQESSLRSSMVQKIRNLVMDAIVEKNITKLLWEKLIYLENKINAKQLKDQSMEEALDESLDDFNQDQNTTNIKLQSIPSLPQSEMACFLPFDCFDIYSCGERETGVYEIYPITRFISTQVLCDMDSTGGGWTVIQRRKRGNPHVNFNATWDEYRRGFGYVPGMYWLADAFRSYKVVGLPFYTFDHDNKHRCAARRGSGWWYDYCTHVDLNTPFLKGNTVWSGTISQGNYLYLSEMLIRRT